MPTRRQLLHSGLAALGYGLAGSPATAAARRIERALSEGAGATPLARLDPAGPTISIEGLPFVPWFGGDSFRSHTTIPFHTAFQGPLPPTTEDVDVAVVGGGISGLATAHLLSDHEPVVFEVRERFGGNAMGEAWRDLPYSLGSAYFITPDEGTFLDRFYKDLELDLVKRDSFPPDPMELDGRVDEGFWSGSGMTSDERRAFERYGRVVRYMGEEAYPEIPLTGDPSVDDVVRAMDRTTFREDLERRMGTPLTPLLAAGVQSYFYSSFGAGIDEISAASGWNFVAAEEFGRWVLPGGNAYMAWSLWNRLREVEANAAPGTSLLRPSCTVIDVRRAGQRYRVTWVDAAGQWRALAARYVVMAGSKHIAKYVLHDAQSIDPAKHHAMQQIETPAYLTATILLNAPVARDFYDIFLIGDRSFPMTPGASEAANRPVDLVDGSYAVDRGLPRRALTFYWPMPWHAARFAILSENAWRDHARLVADDVRAALALLEVDEAHVDRIRLGRWGHAMPIAKPHFIADGHAEHLLRPFDERVYFVNQDNWALPAIENSLLDAEWVAGEIRRRL